MKLLVTGATGFIGSYLVENLLSKGFDVFCLVRKSASKEKINALMEKGAKICYGDITDKNSLRSIPKDIDVVFHLAALIDRALPKYEPYYQVNVLGTKNLVERLLDSNIKKFIFTSSIAAVGLVKTENGLLDENVKCNPITFYGKSKYEAERLLFRYFTENKFPILIIRPPTIYGPGSKHAILDMARLIKRKSLRHEPFVYINRGRAKTSLCYIENVIEALLLTIKCKRIGEIFHVDDGRPYTTKEMVETIASVLGAELCFVSIPKRVARGFASLNEMLSEIFGLKIISITRKEVELFSTDLAFDITKARRYLGYEPKNNFKKFMEETIEWYKENHLL